MTVACNPRTGECQEVRNFVTPKGQTPRPLRKWNMKNKHKDIQSPDSIENSSTMVTEITNQDISLSGETHHADDGGAQ